MFKWLENQVQVDTSKLALTDGTPDRQIPPGWCERMTPEDWADYGRAHEREEDIDEPPYHLPSSAIVNWDDVMASRETRGDWT